MIVKLEVVSGMAEADCLESEWEELLCACAQAIVFDSYGWARANLRTFQDQNLSNNNWILTFRGPEDSLVGVIPLAARQGRRYLRERRWVEFAGQPYADYASCLVRTGFEAPVVEGLVDFCRSHLSDWDGIYLDRLKTGSAFVESILPAMTSRGLIVAVREAGQIRQLTAKEYAGDSQGCIEGKGRPGKSLRKARTRLAEQGELVFDVFTRQEAIIERLETFFEWHVARFARRGLTSPMADSRHREFYRHIVQDLARRERIWLSVLSSGARPVAMRFSPVFNGTLHLYSTCFDDTFAKYSPSMVHLEMLLEHAFRSGMTCVDFGLGESPQKDFAGTASQAVATVEVYSGRVALLEERAYHAAEQIRLHLPLAARAGKLLRRSFPYNVR